MLMDIYCINVIYDNLKGVRRKECLISWFSLEHQSAYSLAFILNLLPTAFYHNLHCSLFKLEPLHTLLQMKAVPLGRDKKLPIFCLASPRQEVSEPGIWSWGVGSVESSL